MPKTHIIIPCFNEAHRLQLAEIETLAETAGAYLILVNDGSIDNTSEVLHALAGKLPKQAECLDLPSNVGKGEAVRLGLQRALEQGAGVLGFVDADMATPIEDIENLINTLKDDDLNAVFGSRVALLGHQIKRSLIRHYLGRVFATAASLTLRLPIYDTQCGAKFFKRSPNLIIALETPFYSRWAFDVELIGRLNILSGASGMKEIPLRAWRDKGGSHMSFPAMIRTFLALIIIRRRLGQYRKS